MEAKELRIGNWVSGNFPNMVVQQVNKYNVECYMPESESDDFSYDLDEIEPIPLTPEILEKAGFKKVLDTWFFDFQENFSVENEGGQFWICGYEYTMQPIKYLHQLQNLFYSLTGEELEINLT